MDRNNLKFKVISLNIRGIRTFEKRKPIFNWLIKQNADMCFLQEIHSTEEIENQWKAQRPEEIFFAHGSVHSRGVAILICKGFDFKYKSFHSDEEGRYLILEVSIQHASFLLVNVYAPNITTKQFSFFLTLSDLILEQGQSTPDCKVFLSRDFKVTLDPALDCLEGNPFLKESVEFLEDIMRENNLVDIWRIRNLDCKKFTWREKSPIIQRRLDYLLPSDTLQEDIVKSDTVTAIKTDHLAITLEIDSLDDQQCRPYFWKFNNSLLEDPVFIQSLRENFPLWLEEINFCDDIRIKWDWMKYKINQESIPYRKLKAKEKLKRLWTNKNDLKVCEKN